MFKKINDTDAINFGSDLKELKKPMQRLRANTNKTLDIGRLLYASDDKQTKAIGEALLNIGISNSDSMLEIVKTLLH